MEKLTLVIAFLFLNTHFFAQSPPCGDWKLQDKRDSYQVYVRDCADSRIKEFKVLDVFQGNFENVARVMEDVETTKRISERCTEARIMKTIDAHTVVQYFYFDMPMGITDRDILSKNMTYATPTAYKSISEIYFDSNVPSRQGVIRLTNARSCFYFEKMPNGMIKLEYTARCDPNGWVPAWLVNMLAGKEAGKMVEKLRGLIQKVQ